MERLMDAGEVADRLKVDKQWVWAKARGGRIPHVRLGRYQRFREAAIEAWTRRNESGGDDEPPRPKPSS